MRHVKSCLVLLPMLFLASGCASSRPSAEMESRVPYRFAFDGSAQRAQTVLRRQLGRRGWGVLNTEPGVVAATKVLSPDEMSSQTVVTGGMVGAGAGGQRGRISFSVLRGDNGTVVRMKGKVASEGASTRGRQTTNSTQRKHPLMVKMGLEIHRLPGFELKDPPAPWLRKWRRAAR